jgi:hypothetical protein
LSHGEVVILKQVTVRGLPREVEEMIKKEARRKGLSLNKAFVSVLERAAVGKKGVKNKKRNLYHDLDHLFGIWSKQEFAVFQRNLDIQRKIDEELWKKAES